MAIDSGATIKATKLNHNDENMMKTMKMKQFTI